MTIWKFAMACSLAGAVLAGPVEQAVAAPLPTNLATMKAAVASDVTPVHWRGGGVGWGLGGFAAGAIIGGAIANSQAQAAANDAAAYCSQRFRTYDPASGTYIAKGGIRRSCP